MPNYLKDITINEISGVDKPAQEPAVTAIIKAANPLAVNKADRVDLVSTETNGHVHSILVDIVNGRLDFIVYFAGDPDRPYDYHDHQVVRTEGGFELTLNEGHTHSITDAQVDAVLNEVIVNKNLEADKNSLHALLKNGITMRGQIQPVVTEGDTEMTKEEKAAFDRLQSVVSLTTVEKAHFDGLDAEAQDAFLAKSADERSKEIGDAEVPTETVTTKDATIVEDSENETLTLDGETISKADNPIAYAALLKAKQADEQAAELRLSKRAGEVLKGLSKDEAVRNVVMKQLDAIGDESLRESAIKSVTTLIGISNVAKSLDSSEESEQGENVVEDKTESSSADERKSEADFRTEIKAANPDWSEFEVNRAAYNKFRNQE